MIENKEQLFEKWSNLGLCKGLKGGNLDSNISSLYEYVPHNFDEPTMKHFQDDEEYDSMKEYEFNLMHHDDDYNSNYNSDDPTIKHFQDD